MTPGYLWLQALHVAALIAWFAETPVPCLLVIVPLAVARPF
jgi:uncharacterized membrane protein